MSRKDTEVNFLIFQFDQVSPFTLFFFFFFSANENFNLI